MTFQARRFHRHDKEVLRFKGVWDDLSAGGVRRRYDVLFYLQDETIAVMNLREDKRNSGRDEGAVRRTFLILPRIALGLRGVAELLLWYVEVRV